jgi:hypothetical protein
MITNDLTRCDGDCATCDPAEDECSDTVIVSTEEVARANAQ